MAEVGEPDPHDELRSFLREQVALTPKRTPSGYDAIKAVLPEIRALKAKRRTDAEIRELLARMGVKLSLATLRQYTQKATREAAGHTPVRRRGKAATRSPAGTAPLAAERRPELERPVSAGHDPRPAQAHTPASATVGHRLSTKDL
ncbi:hypothetical protein [Methylobacterium persicinum]|uniref:Transposase n=2 Tax=Methylobacteriaceae TaxID=119045 RepID=A0ABU0HSG7_9HYPH|nr:hypothetical protein [Methylobacterium persicinum]MDQ0444852.1 hypothetical protein [Methylobacterium persicinum]GJE36042.1 hypothetical protein KHHGKMAE_0088 [Methylobacterium persicinum]